MERKSTNADSYQNCLARFCELSEEMNSSTLEDRQALVVESIEVLRRMREIRPDLTEVLNRPVLGDPAVFARIRKKYCDKYTNKK